MFWLMLPGLWDNLMADAWGFRKRAPTVQRGEDD